MSEHYVHKWFTPGLKDLPNQDVRFLPEPGRAEFKKWRKSGLRIDEWIAKQHPESATARGERSEPNRLMEFGEAPAVLGHEALPQPVERKPAHKVDTLGPLFEEKFGLQPQPESDGWEDGRD